MRACAAARFGTATSPGAGRGGRPRPRRRALAERLAEAGCRAGRLATSIAEKRLVAEQLGAAWVDPARRPCPVRRARAVRARRRDRRRRNVDRLRCEIVCGSANNQLADERSPTALAERGILYAPDFIVNAGGLINVYREIAGYDEGAGGEAGAGDRDDDAGDPATAAERAITPLRRRRRARARAARAQRVERMHTRADRWPSSGWSARARFRYDEAREAQKALEGAHGRPARCPTCCSCSSTHPSTPRGAAATADELPMGEDWYRMQGIEVVDTDRGGRVTYHGPGPAGRLSDHRACASSPIRDDVHEYVRRWSGR